MDEVDRCPRSRGDGPLAGSGPGLQALVTPECVASGDGLVVHRYYTFGFGDSNAGWYEISETESEISMNATFMLEGQRTVNRVSVRHAGDEVTAYRVGDGPWVANPDPSRIYPTSAYALLVRRIADRLTYVGLTEGDESELREVVLIRDGDIVTEIVGGAVSRRFCLRNGVIVRIHWGDAISELRPTLELARAGSDFAP